MTTTFYFNTGVRVFVMEYADMGKPKHYNAEDKIINGERHIPFIVEDVPAGAIFKFASPYNNVPTYSEKIKPFKIVGGGLCSDYAYFLIP